MIKKKLRLKICITIILYYYIMYTILYLYFTITIILLICKLNFSKRNNIRKTTTNFLLRFDDFNGNMKAVFPYILALKERRQCFLLFLRFGENLEIIFLTAPTLVNSSCAWV